MNKNKILETLTSISKIKEWLSDNKATSLVGAALIVLLIIESFFHSRIVVIVEKQVTQIIEERSIPLIFKRIDYGYFPPRLIMKDAVYSGGQNNAEVEEVSISAKVIPLIKLKVVPSTLSLYKPEVRWKIDLKESNEESPNLSFDKIMDLIPLYRIKIKEGNLYLQNDKTNLRLESLDLTLTKSTRSIRADLSSITEIGHGDFFENFSVNVNANLDENSIYIKYLNLQKQNSIAKISGSVRTEEIYKKDRNLKSLASIYKQINEIRMNTKIELSDFNSTLKLATKSSENFEGGIQATGYFNQESEEQKSSIAFSAENIKTPKLNLGSAKIGAQISPTSILIKENSSFSFVEGSEVKLESALIEKKDSGYWANFHVKSKRFLLEDLLYTLDVPNQSFNSPISLESKCRGSLSPVLALSCSGDLAIQKFILSLSQKPFIDLNKMKSSFKVQVGAKELSFTAKPVYENSEKKSFTGDVNGNVHYRKGFDISYDSDAFDLEFLNFVAGQELTGVIAASGNTKGSAKWAKFFVDINNSEELVYNQFYLGQAKNRISYSYPNLNIIEVKGNVTPEDSYVADFSLDTRADLMNLKIEGEGFSNQSISKIFEKTFSFPEGIDFKNADFTLFLVGVPDIEKLDLDLVSSFPKFTAFKENFNASQIKLKGKNGDWSFYETNFKKKNSIFSVDGKVLGFKDIDLTLKSLDLQLWDVDNLQRVGMKLEGPAVFRLDAKGPIDGPKATGRVQLKSTKGLSGEALGNTDVGFRLFENQVTFKGEAFNEKIVGSGIYPLNSEGELSFNGKVTELDFFQIVEFVFDDSLIHYLPVTFSSDLTVSFNEKTPILRGWVDNLDIEFKSANESIFKLKNVETIRFDKGDSPLSLMTTDNYKADLYVHSIDSNKVELKLNGQVEAHALQSFIPKTEILRGLIDIKSLSIIVSKDSFEHFGEINFSNGTFKNKSFPYSFTDLNTKLDFNKNKIGFNRLDTRINNNPVRASGYLTSLPLSIETSIRYKDLQIEYPEGISSLSDGDLRVSGSKLPLLAKGRIKVKEGEFRRDLLSGADGKTITANKFLPKEILYKNAPPFNLDLLLIIEDKYLVRTSEINGSAKGDLKLDGNAFNPLTKGRIELKRGMTINFLDKIFAVQEGRLNYSNNYIDSPDLYIDATTEVADNNDITSNKYLIRMLVEGSTENLKFSFNSTPSLAEKEIISLLTLGTISTQSVGQEINTQQQATHSGLQVGSFLLQKNKGIQELQKKTGTEIGISSSVNAFNVNPKVQLKKKWSPKLSSTVSQSFGNQQVLELSTEYQVNQNVSTSFTIQNNQTQDATQLLNRQVQQGEIFGVDLQYKFEFD